MRKFKVGDIFFYQYLDSDWVIGEINEISYESYVEYTILSTNIKDNHDPPTAFSNGSRVWKKAIKLDNENDTGTILAKIL